MSDEVKQDHYDLLHKIERNDRHFRMAQSIFMTLIGLILVGLIAAQFVVINNFQSQSAERAKSLKALQQSNNELAESNKHLSEQSNRYIQCIAQFFASEDRQNRVLEDLDSCIYTDSGETVPGVIIPQTSSNSADTGAVQGDNSSDSGTNPSKNGNAQGGQEQRPPQHFVGIPLCVPFTDVCVRQ